MKRRIIECLKRRDYENKALCPESLVGEKVKIRTSRGGRIARGLGKMMAKNTV